MRKKLFAILAVAALIVTLGAGCGGGTSSGPEGQTGGGGGTGAAAGIADVCNYFPKELIEEAIGKPIVKVEVPFMGKESCFYYTLYSDTFDHTPYGDEPGGTPIVVVYDDEDFAKDRISNEKTGSTYAKDETIGMDNFVVRDHGGTIWQVVLILGQDKYIRMHFVHSAINGEELVKIGAKFAEKIKGQ